MSSGGVVLPSQFGRYQILRKLGSGGMGTVYLAQDTQLHRQVALKVPHFSETDGPTVIERFLREARIAASIQHPNICAVYDFGEIGGIRFLTMPYIQGTPLSSLIDPTNPWPAEQALPLIRQLALAIQVMHDRGVIHRDLKPSNVLMRGPSDPVLMDFGLARSLTADRVTATGAAIGTPAYMAPEQVEGKEVGPATDQYALGVILYELLTGSLPFEGQMAAIYGQILYTMPSPPSMVRAGIDPRLDPVVLRALAKAPAERYASMLELAQSLEACQRQLASGPPTTPTPGRGDTPMPGPVLDLPAAAESGRASCIYCNARLKVLASVLGKTIKCPNCEGRLEVIQSERGFAFRKPALKPVTGRTPGSPFPASSGPATPRALPIPPAPSFPSPPRPAAAPALPLPAAPPMPMPPAPPAPPPFPTTAPNPFQFINPLPGPSAGLPPPAPLELAPAPAPEVPLPIDENDPLLYTPRVSQPPLWPWILGGIVLACVLGGGLYFLLSG